MKRAISLLFTLIFAVTSFSALALQAGAYSNNTNIGTAKAIDVNKSYTSNLLGYADKDWFKFTLTKPGKVSVSFTHEYVDEDDVLWYISLYNENQTKIGNLWSFVGEKIKTETTCNHGLPAGTYYVMVESNGHNLYSTADFDIKVNFTASTNWEKEFNDNYYTSNSVKLNQKYYGSTMYYTDKDWYKFTLTKAEKINIAFAHAFVDSKDNLWSIAVYDDNNTRITDYYFYKGNVTNAVKTGYISLKAGTYYIEIKAFGFAQSSNVDYNISVSRQIPTPKLTSVTNTATGVKITWNKVAGAECYTVLRKEGNGKWTAIKGSIKNNYYVDTKAKSGVTYKYSVKAKQGSEFSAYNTTGLTIKYLTDPTLKAPSSTKSGISLKWTKVNGAQGYVIYRKTGNGSYGKLVTRKGVSALSYVDKSAKKGKSYTYKIKAYYGKTYSAQSNTRTIKDKY